jgi:hypothetical protein
MPSIPLQTENLFGPKIIRSEAHALRMNHATRMDVERTIAFYRRVLKMVSTIAMTHWPEIGSLTGNEPAKALERLIHPTSKRPTIRYAVVSRALGKMPSYFCAEQHSNMQSGAFHHSCPITAIGSMS